MTREILYKLDINDVLIENISKKLFVVVGLYKDFVTCKILNIDKCLLEGDEFLVFYGNNIYSYQDSPDIKFQSI